MIGCIIRVKKNDDQPITVAARSKASAVFARSNTGVMGSNPTLGMDVCVQVAALRRANPPSKESY
jgi:hypothetical protein